MKPNAIVVAMVVLRMRTIIHSTTSLLCTIMPFVLRKVQCASRVARILMNPGPNLALVAGYQYYVKSVAHLGQMVHKLYQLQEIHKNYTIKALDMLVKNTGQGGYPRIPTDTNLVKQDLSSRVYKIIKHRSTYSSRIMKMSLDDFYHLVDLVKPWMELPRKFSEGFWDDSPGGVIALSQELDYYQARVDAKHRGRGSTQLIADRVFHIFNILCTGDAMVRDVVFFYQLLALRS